MPTALIADDEPHLATSLQAALATAWPELKIIATARNGVEAAERIDALAPDFAFLDIRMPALTGLEVAQGIEGHTRVVFVTAYDEFAVAAFDQHALDYVLKPVKAERLAKTVERLKAALEVKAAGPSRSPSRSPSESPSESPYASPYPSPPSPLSPSESGLAAALQRLLAAAPVAASETLRHVRASQGDLVHQIDVNDVFFFHADDKYTCVQTAGAEHLIRATITELAGQLDPKRFRQIHRSTIVNVDHIAGTRRDDLSRVFVRVKGHARELPVSCAYVHLFKAM